MRPELARLRAAMDTNAGRRLLLLAGIAAWLLHHQVVFLGFYNNDDINYARFAHQAMNGQLPLFAADNHFALRWGPVYVTALFYRIFGVTEFATAAFGLISLLSTALLVYQFTKRKPLLEYFLTLVLFFGNYSLLFYTHRLLPDSGICFFVFLGYYAYHSVRFGTSPCKWYWPVLVAVAVTAAVLTKETVVLILPACLFLACCDWKSSAGRRFWIMATIYTLMLLGVYLCLFKVFTGDWFYRLHLMDKLQYLNSCRYDLLPARETARRVAYRLWHAFLLNGDMIILGAGAVAFYYRKTLLLAVAERRLVTVFFMLLLSANFMSISWHAYVPLCEDPRHFLFLMPFAAIAGAKMLRAYLLAPTRYLLLPVVFLALTAWIFFSGGGGQKFIYAGITVLLVAYRIYWTNHSRPIAALLFLNGLVILLAVTPVYDIITKKQSYFFDHKSFIRRVFPAVVSKGLVMTGDDITAELSEYFVSFDNREIRFENLLRSKGVPAGPVFLLVTSGPGRYQNRLFAEEAQKYSGRGLHKFYQHGTLILYQVINKDSLAPLKKQAIY